MEIIQVELNNPTAELMIPYLQRLRAMTLWFHGAHVLTKGTGFAGDHVNLYGKIYSELVEELDAALEKAVGLSKNENTACPIKITGGALQILNQYPSPADTSALTIAATGLELEEDYLETTANLYKNLKETNSLTLGLDDFLMASANQHEGYVYLLGQRIKINLNS